MWKDKYKVGVMLIDEQHKELFKRAEDFIEVIQNERSWEAKLEQVKKTMAFMQEYVVFHFDGEEAYMKEINYPDVTIHMNTHRKFKEWINTHIELFQQDGYSEEKVQEFGVKLIKWLILHVGKMDQEIGKFVKK
ncbi:hemerythrin domain-containing protein [Tissierella sp.]|uniref:bacteriohemerythrin n=1 Tax=Tissierella sp. TaxID=41274 RepID=UPI00285FE099|nr:hemerythrin domain-containing protein [Tissierella sp.]MDR7856700.1 hemerythrin domain-containing protein [Tissierella sp.]